MRSGYWKKLYNRANSRVYTVVLQEVKQQTGLKNRDLKGKLKNHAASDMVMDRYRGYRRDRTTWALAIEYLIYDLVEVAEGDFSRYVLKQQWFKTHKAKKEAL